MSIPDELKARAQWVTWKNTQTKPNGKLTKEPFNPRTGKHASSTNPQTWTAYDLATKAASQRRHDGVGFVFSKDDPYAGVDLDDCLDGDTLQPWAAEIVEALHSYTEISPSGTGVKIFVKGSVPSSVKTAQVEIYDQARYFTVTGNHFPGTPAEIVVANGALEHLHAAYAKPHQESSPRMTTGVVDDAYLRAWAERIIDSALDRMRHATDGERHNTRIDMGRLLGGLIPHGLMSEDRAERLLYDANVPDANHHAEAKAIRDGIAMGRSAPLTVPDPPPQPVFDAQHYACCPTHERRLTKGRTKGWYCAERDASTASGWCDFWWKGDGYVEPSGKDESRRYTSDQRTGEILDAEAPKSWREHGITLAALQHKQFEPERWVIEHILPEGACLLAAKYKSKKSWLSLALGLAVSMGGKALGRLSVSQGRVLLLDLEGKQVRVQKRARAMLGVRNVPWPENFHVFNRWPQGDDGMRELEGWFASYPDTALVVIDVLGDFRRPIDRFEAPYQYDRDTVQPLNALFEQYHAAGILVHHFNKAKNDDIMDSISGTTGLPSAVNTMWGLSRDVNDSNITVLHMRGRDLENDDPIALKWDTFLTQHVIEGPAAEVATTAERRSVLDVLKDDMARTPKEIATELERSVPSVQQLLRKLVNEGLVDKAGYGKYAIVRRADQSSHTDQSDQSGKSSYSDRYTPNSDRLGSTLIGGDQSSFSQEDAPNSPKNTNSDHSDRYPLERQETHVWGRVPRTKQTVLRLYLRSNKESDQDRARDLCAEYGIDYDAAYRETHGSNAP